MDELVVPVSRLDVQAYGLAEPDARLATRLIREPNVLGSLVRPRIAVSAMRQPAAALVVYLDGVEPLAIGALDLRPHSVLTRLGALGFRTLGEHSPAPAMVPVVESWQYAIGGPLHLLVCSKHDGWFGYPPCDCYL